MSTFAQERGHARKPSRHVIASPDVFQSLWSARPVAEVAMGIRLLSDGEIQTVRAEASRYAAKMFALGDMECVDVAGRLECFNDTLIIGGLAFALTDANDITIPYFGEFAETTVRQALTSPGARFLWDEVARAHVELSGSVPHATDEDLAELAARLVAGGMAKIKGDRIHALRKLSAHVLGELRAADPDFSGNPEEEASEYTVRIAS